MDEEFDIVIAGGGVAGLTAALTAARLGCKTLVLTGDVLGGLLVSINKVEGFPGFVDGVPGYDLCPMIQEQAVAAGAQFTAANLDDLKQQNGGWQLTSGKARLRARAVILATGATLKELGVPGAGRLRGNGVSHCASCDAPLVRKKTVAVVGGGDSALQEALTLADFAERVIILQSGAELTAQARRRRSRVGGAVRLHWCAAGYRVTEGQAKARSVGSHSGRCAATDRTAGRFRGGHCAIRFGGPSGRVSRRWSGCRSCGGTLSGRRRVIMRTARRRELAKRRRG